MTKITKLALASLMFATFGVAYESSGDIKLMYTGYKTVKKIGVDGTFKDIKFSSTKSDDFQTFLKSMSVDIDALSLDTKLPFRNKNISILFTNAKSSKITAKIADVSGKDNAGKVLVNITMNDVSKEVEFAYKVEGGEIMAKGKLDMLDFAMDKSFADFAKKCKGLHSGKTWSEVGIKFKIPYKK